MQQNNQSDKLLILENKVASQPNNVEAMYELADAYADQNRWIKAIEKYQSALKLDSTNADLYNSLGIAYEEVGRLEEAEKVYQQAIALNTQDSMPYYNLGILYEEQKRIPEAVQAYRKCLQYSTDSNERSEIKKRLTALTSETPTGQSRLAYRLAAIVLCLGVFINIISVVIGGDVTTVIPSLIDLILAAGLFHLRPGARKFTLFRAVTGAILLPILVFVGQDAAAAIVISVMQWGYCGAMILLLTGQSKTWRLTLAIGIFVVFTLVIFVLLLLVIVLPKIIEMQQLDDQFTNDITQVKNVTVSIPDEVEIDQLLSISALPDEDCTVTKEDKACSISPNQAIKWGWGFCENDATTLHSKVSTAQVDLIVDNVRIPHNLIYQQEKTYNRQQNAYCHIWLIKLSDWQSGSTVRLENRARISIFDTHKNIFLMNVQ
jgi:tetratricopeptide (TPR) repeat protein